MKLLLDTHLLLWAAGDSDRLSTDTRVLLSDEANTLHFSSASIWEVAIKSAYDRPDFSVDPAILRRGLLENGYFELVINSEHAIAAAALPPIHRDPFDRMLIAQAAIEGFLLLTSDSTVADYPGPVRMVKKIV